MVMLCGGASDSATTSPSVGTGVVAREEPVPMSTTGTEEMGSSPVTFSLVTGERSIVAGVEEASTPVLPAMSVTRSVAGFSTAGYRTTGAAASATPVRPRLAREEESLALVGDVPCAGADECASASAALRVTSMSSEEMLGLRFRRRLEGVERKVRRRCSVEEF